MKISYAILTHNEGTCIGTLIEFLVKHKNPDDEIVIVDDYSTEITKDILEEHLADDHITLYQRIFDGDDTQKNYLNSKCTGDYIFQIDADELPDEYIMTNLVSLLEQNPIVDLFLVPRINTVLGLTSEDIRRWGWTVNNDGWVNFPDYQPRVYRNTPAVRWDGLLHSTIIGASNYAFLPAEKHWCLLHEKEIERQRKQNELYSKIEMTGKTKYKV